MKQKLEERFSVQVLCNWALTEGRFVLTWGFYLYRCEHCSVFSEAVVQSHLRMMGLALM